MIVEFSRTILINGNLYQKGDVDEVSKTAGQMLIKRGQASEVSQKPKDRQNKVEYKQNGAWVSKYVNGEKVESKRKSEAEAEWDL